MSTHFLYKWKIEDEVVGIVACILKMGSSLIFAFGLSLSSFYIATIPDGFFVLSTVAVRSTVTKLVADEEQGKMNAITSAIEAFVLCISAAFYSFIYSISLVEFAGAFYLISESLAFLGLIAFS